MATVGSRGEKGVCEAGKHAQRGTCLLLHGGHSAWLIFLSLYPCYLSTFSRLAWGGHLYVLSVFSMHPYRPELYSFGSTTACSEAVNLGSSCIHEYLVWS